ncbi:FG-GAP-like repeat-containing protein [Citreimonas sp.]|uniref:FG-GAP-like repeat-containing protein n=1 Tax=Citreimonas sp. TaxID=3036715 RepID=UPI0035C7BFF5
MTTLIRPACEKRFLLALLIVGTLAYLFWTGSRYPALNEKAMMSGAIQLEDPLSFEAKYQLTEAMGTLERIFWTTLNWINTNRKGMTFGILFAAAFMTAVSFLQRRALAGGFSNAALGMALGAPLGVCANCAAPIGKGMYASGMRAETTLAAMVASPTLNIVVLTMLFSLVPVWMAVTKLALSLVVILVAVPLIARTLPRRQIEASEIVQTPWSGTDLYPEASESLLSAVWAVAKAYAANLWYIVKLTVPMMLLAGFLGAVVGTLFPTEAITGLAFGLGALALVCALGLFLPVPMSFDVVLAGALIAAGLSHGYVMALLITLGSFSVYSFFIIAQALGMRAALLMAAVIGTLGFAAGAGAHLYHQRQTDRALELLLGQAEAPVLWGAAQAATAEGLSVTGDAGAVTVTATPLAPPSPREKALFERVEAASLGIDKPVEFTMRDMWPPFWEGRSLSTGDIDGDGDDDLVIASTEIGLYLYENDGTGRFTRMAVDPGPLAEMAVFNAALADLDNDGAPDLFVATYLDGNHWWRNVGGTFGAEPPVPVANVADTPLSMALSFADIDGNGRLDVALGNWAAGWYRRIPGEESRNRVILNDGAPLGETYSDLPGIPGETLSILFSDLDGDGAQDLIVGNDFDIPDYVYLGDGQGGLRMVARDDGLIPHVTTTTMAVKTADLFNDGTPDLYLAQIAGRSSGVSERLRMQPIERYCDAIENAEAKAVCQTNMDIKRWYRSGNSFDPGYAERCLAMTGRYQAECRAMLVKDLAIQRRDPALCDLIPAGQAIPQAYCRWHFAPAGQPAQAELDAALPQVLRSNVLLERDGDAFVDRAAARRLDVGGWSWDTKIADFDLDGWQDVYIVNGTWVPNEVTPSNLYFRNDQDAFTEASEEAGLTDFLMTASATAFDMDGDGDLDMVTHPVNGPLAAFVNGAQGGRLSVILDDRTGNRAGIGAVVTLVGLDGIEQRREIQLGGGFMSFDAPGAHFGLGEAGAAAALRIRWPDGAETVVEGPVEAGQRYTLRRAP